jgi:hypothetical protein
MVLKNFVTRSRDGWDQSLCFWSEETIISGELQIIQNPLQLHELEVLRLGWGGGLGVKSRV